MRLARLAACCCILLVPAVGRAQEPARDTTARRDTLARADTLPRGARPAPGLRLRLRGDTLVRPGSPALTDFSRQGPAHSAEAAAAEARALARRLGAQGRVDALWGQTVARSLGVGEAAGPASFAPWDPLESTCRHASLSIL